MVEVYDEDYDRDDYIGGCHLDMEGYIAPLPYGSTIPGGASQSTPL